MCSAASAANRCRCCWGIGEAVRGLTSSGRVARGACRRVAPRTARTVLAGQPAGCWACGSHAGCIAAELRAPLCEGVGGVGGYGVHGRRLQARSWADSHLLAIWELPQGGSGSLPPERVHHGGFGRPNTVCVLARARIDSASCTNLLRLHRVPVGSFFFAPHPLPRLLCSLPLFGQSRTARHLHVSEQAL